MDLFLNIHILKNEFFFVGLDIIDEKFIDEEGSLDYHNLSSVCISGLDTYYETNKISKYPYARKDDLPF